ncbi:mitochondrial thiamine pyrophosphate carrier [Drosophila ficusphila]|uniref:mitochondrial thiamine pyrophosphate carrier n=1 Tax=Drosophila ficusphila TaxID=30025 RepID=UPI0007E6FB2C|nr:mitochondrial thiamine pyrophosphate carrier [Drosophila ficusphila]XP_043063994.1 mitochondrial thiamine pyrophosphate carrier [Drosophila ficusphila]
MALRLWPRPPLMPHPTTDNSGLIQVMQAVGGGIAGAATRTITQPLDVLKIRFQMQVEPLTNRKGSKYRGILHAFRSVYAEEGMRGMFRGHNSGQVLSISYALVQFWSYEQLRSMAHQSVFWNERPFLMFFVCGGLAGCLGACAAQPFDVVRTQMVAADPSSRRSQMSTWSGLRRVYRTEGWDGFTRGMSFTLVQIFPLVGANFFFYKYLNALVLAAKPPDLRQEIHGAFLFINGALSGVAAKMLVYPADLLKKRIQLMAFKQERKTFGRNPDCPTLLGCITTTFRVEGIGGFYKGMSPTLLKAGLTSAVYFTIYDLFKRHYIAPLREPDKGRQKRGKT